jgi:crossover junction endodeoxyribonuclease RuvC
MASSTAATDRTGLRVLGVDPGSRVTGFGVVEFEDHHLRYIDCGRIRVADQPFATRLHRIYTELSAIIRQHRPQVMAVEKVFVAHNAQSALSLGHARGAAMVAATNENIDVEEYTALQVKQAVVGNGKADKAQVQHMIRVLLGLRQAPPSDAADALACGICHIHTWDNARRLQIGLGDTGSG